MKALRNLAGQTAIYGLPSIVGRFLNYLLVPVHTAIFLPEQFGVITTMYAYVAFLVVLLTYGMETAYFRFQSKADKNGEAVYSTVLRSLFCTTAFFILLTTLFSAEIANWINYPENAEYVVWFAFIVGLDAVTSIPMARLRIEEKAFTFALINLLSILINIGLNLFWIAYCIPAYKDGVSNFFIDHLYSPGIGVGYVFLANLFASIFKFLVLSPWYLKLKSRFDLALLKEMFIYGSPLLISSLAIIVNEQADKLLLNWLLTEQKGIEYANAQVGIYGACYKLSIVITLFIQAFRYAAEPFFFREEKNKDARKTYARVMKYFILVCLFIFLMVTLYIDLFKFFLASPAYWEGLHIVPILLGANICLGIFYNLSVWYKLTGMTRYGALIAAIGAVITIVLNLLLIPAYGYTASAWITLICYSSMVVISYLVGRQYYRIDYPLRKIALYIAMGLLVYGLGSWLNHQLHGVIAYLLTAVLILLYLAGVYTLEKPKKAIIS